MNLGTSEAALGRYQRALELLEEAHERFGHADGSPWRSVCETHIANTLVQLGQFARARQVLKPVSETVRSSTHARRLIIEARIDRALSLPALPRLQQALDVLGPDGDAPTRMLAQLDLARETGAAEALALCARVREAADAIEYASASMKARIVEIEAYLRADDNAAAVARARDVHAAMEECRPDMYWPEACWIVCQVLDVAGDQHAANDVLRRAANWIEHTALPHVSPFFRDSFLHRNPVNRAVLAAARRRRTRGDPVTPQ
jgi:tetratricopeptide (TPR) repeat protein